ncbi:MAG: DUF2493 domain-containing protein [Rhodobacteraceae bacterium]|nr:DUF2493 domain-containing protein [Paracoccaceae bacterium]
MRLLVIGGRHLDDVALIRRSLNAALKRHPVEVLIHGGHAVLGSTAEEIARDHGLHIVRYPANWRLHGQQAESIRNRFMLADSRPDVVLALPGGEDTHVFAHQLRAAGITLLTPETLACTAQAQPSRPLLQAAMLRPSLP